MAVVLSILSAVTIIALANAFWNIFFDLPKSFRRIAAAMEESNRLQRNKEVQ